MNTTKPPHTSGTYGFGIFSLLATEFVLLAMGAACAFSSGDTDGFCALSESTRIGIMAAFAVVFIGVLAWLRKKRQWKAALWVSAAPLVLLGLWIAVGLALQMMK